MSEVVLEHYTPQVSKKLWTALRVCFWTMIGLYLIATEVQYFSPEFSIILGMAIGICGIATFVISIVHLTKYKEKAFAITALVFSSIIMLFFIAGFIIGLARVI